MRFNKLPNHIKYDIFSTMSTKVLCTTVAPVCREWRQFSYDSTLWTTVKLHAQKQSKEQMIKILERSSRLRELTLEHASDFSWLNSFPINKTLRRLTLFDCDSSAETISHLVSIFPNVEVFTDCCTSANNDILVPEIIRWKFLKQIHLSSAVGDSNRCLNLIAENCQNLCCFNGARFHDVDERVFINFIQQRGSQLYELIIAGLHNLTSSSYQSLSKCHRLVELSLFGSKNLTDFNFCNLQELPSLRTLCVWESEKLFTSGRIPDLFSRMNVFPLEFVSIRKCVHMKYNDLDIILQNCRPNLRQFLVSLTNNLTLAELCRLAKIYGYIFEFEDFSEHLSYRILTREDL